MPADLNRYVIELAVSGRFGRPFKYLDEVGSTNAEALEWSRQGAPHGAMVVADHQSQGRGRLGRSWFSEPGTALQLSLVLRPVIPLDVFGLVSTTLSLACAEAIEDLTKLLVGLKWPNDLTVGGRKLAGILVETRVVGHQIDVAVAGIGINVSPPRSWPEGVAATSIGAELELRGRDPRVDRSQLLVKVLECIERRYELVETGRGAAEVLRLATERSEVLGEEVVVRRPHGPTVQGVATRLLPSGALEVASNGEHIVVQVGEVEQLRPAREQSEAATGTKQGPGSSTVEGSRTLRAPGREIRDDADELHLPSGLSGRPGRAAAGRAARAEQERKIAVDDGSRRPRPRGNARLRVPLDSPRSRAMTPPDVEAADLASHLQRARSGGAPKYHEKLAGQGKLFVRDRLSLLLDSAEGFAEDGLLVNALAGDLPADGVVTGVGTVDGRPVAVMANDSTVKAGSWGARTVEKIIRIIELARRHEHPLVYLVDSAGARITDQVDLFPGRRGAGKIFYNQVQASGKVPQVCCLFGPSAAGGAYIPAFCDVVFMVEGNASMYLGSPRMAEEVIGETVTLEEMGGARMHCEVSGCGDLLVPDDKAAIEAARAYLGYFGKSWREAPPRVEARRPGYTGSLASLVPGDEGRAFDMYGLVAGLVDESSFFEIKPSFAPELIVGLARIEGRAVGLLANQPTHKGGVLFVDSADKAARFIWLCDAFNIPLVFLADVPGFMIGSAVERQGIIRHGAKMITAVSEATVPKICVVVRKAYGAGLYAMAGPGFEPDATIALPTARIAVMGPEPAVNAVYFNKIEAIQDPAERERFVAERRAEFEKDIDIFHLASENVVDAVVEPDELRSRVSRRLEIAAGKDRSFSSRRHGVPPV